MFMHTLILGDSDAGKTWVVINILLHEFSPYLPAYEKIVVIGARKQVALGTNWPFGLRPNTMYRVPPKHSALAARIS